MLQVDLLWVYGIGAMFATAAAKQLKKLSDEKKIKDLPHITPFGNVYFATLLAYLGTIFIPEAGWLLWNFPHWETMHMWNSLDEIPAWVVTLCLSADILLAILGFWAAYKFIESGREFAAHLQWIIGYFAFFFVLLHGWDATGWQRFTWDPTVIGKPFPQNPAIMFPEIGAFLGFATSNVALTLYAMAIPTIVPMLVGGYIWLKSGYKLIGVNKASSLAMRSILLYIGGVIFSLILAAISSIISIAITLQGLGVSFGAFAGILTAAIIFLAFHRSLKKVFNFTPIF